MGRDTESTNQVTRQYAYTAAAARANRISVQQEHGTRRNERKEMQKDGPSSSARVSRIFQGGEKSRFRYKKKRYCKKLTSFTKLATHVCIVAPITDGCLLYFDCHRYSVRRFCYNAQPLLAESFALFRKMQAKKRQLGLVKVY